MWRQRETWKTKKYMKTVSTTFRPNSTLLSWSLDEITRVVLFVLFFWLLFWTGSLLKGFKKKNNQLGPDSKSLWKYLLEFCMNLQEYCSRLQKGISHILIPLLSFLCDYSLWWDSTLNSYLRHTDHSWEENSYFSNIQCNVKSQMSLLDRGNGFIRE